MSPTLPRLNVSDWETAIGSEREPRSFAADPVALDVLRQRFRDISTRTREHRQSAWIKRPGYAALQKKSDSALELTRLAFHELSQFDHPTAPTIPLHSLSQLLVENQTRLVEIEERLGRLQSLVVIAERLREPLELLIGSGAGSLGTWKALIDDLLTSGACQGPVGAEVWAGTDFDGFLAAEAWPHAWFYASAMHRAMWTVTLQRLLPELQPYPIEVLVLPALLADCGLLIQFPEHGRITATEPAPTTADYQRHPEISAALIAMIDHVSPLSSLLAGQHHERLDGTGYPRRLKGDELHAVSRSFSTMTRWSELLLKSAAANSPAEAQREAAQALSRDARQGTLDLQFVRRLLTAIDAHVSADAGRQALRSSIRESLPELQPTSTDVQSPVRIIDGAQTIPPPAMLSARVSAFKDDGSPERPTPPPRPAVSGYR